jgi:hypothetical protein
MAGRSKERITKRDLRRLLQLAEADRLAFFRRKPDTSRLYSRRLFAVALCQGAALHYLDGKSGVKDFDVWSFYRANPERQFPPRRRGQMDFGDPKFGATDGLQGYVGRRVDLIGRSIVAGSYDDPVAVLRDYLRGRRTESARRLAEKAMVLLYPPELFGRVVWSARNATTVSRDR